MYYCNIFMCSLHGQVNNEYILYWLKSILYKCVLSSCLNLSNVLDYLMWFGSSFHSVVATWLAPFQDHKQPIAPFQEHKAQIIPSSQDQITTADVRDIIALKHTFPTSLNTTGNIPEEYTIHVDPSIHPVQHAHRKVPIEVRQETEKALQKW